MAGTDGEIVLPPNSTGSRLDMDATDFGGGVTRHRQRGRVAGDGVLELADVKNADPAGGAYGIVARLAGSVPLPAGAATQATLAQVLTQLQAIVAELGGTLLANVTGSVVSISGSVPITAAALPLPAGAATQATLAAIQALLPAALGAGGGLKVDGSGTAIPVQAAALPLPAGAATQVTLAAVLTALGGTLAVDASGHNLTIGGTVAVSIAAVVHVDDNAGSLTVDSPQLPAALAAGGGMKVEGVAGGVAQPVSLASAPLPAGASTEATLAAIKTDVDKIPASPAAEHTTAASPHAARLSDGAAFYDGAKTGQLPAALVGGRVDVNVGAAAARVASTDSIEAIQSNKIVIDGVVYTKKRVIVNLAVTGDVIAAVGGKKLRIVGGILNANVDGTITPRDNVTAIGAAWTIRMGGGFVIPTEACGHWETTSGNKFSIALTTITQLSGVLFYVEI